MFGKFLTIAVSLVFVTSLLAGIFLFAPTGTPEVSPVAGFSETAINTTSLDSLSDTVIILMVAIIPIFIVLGVFDMIMERMNIRGRGKK